MKVRGRNGLVEGKWDTNKQDNQNEAGFVAGPRLLGLKDRLRPPQVKHALLVDWEQ